MNETNKTFWSDPDVGLLLLRVFGGGLYFLHGLHKLSAGIEAQTNMLVEAGLPGFLMNFYVVTEVLAPILLVLGVFTRLSAASIVMTMLVILYVLPFPIMALNEHGAWVVELQVLYLAIPLGLFFTGPGRFRVWGSKSGNWLLD